MFEKKKDNYLLFEEVCSFRQNALHSDLSKVRPILNYFHRLSLEILILFYYICLYNEIYRVSFVFEA
jgi:hypothetical protein